MNEDNCQICNSQLIKTLTPHTPHYARLDCPKCGFKGWARNPNSEKIGTTQTMRIGKRTVRQVCDFHKMKEEHCFFCQRVREQLGFSETLTVDHIEELSESNIDKDIIENMQVLCSSCHKLKNWCRLYMNWHFKKEEKKDDSTNTPR
jgi:5-methylcytosine-specific restriction endonuclease McrA